MLGCLLLGITYGLLTAGPKDKTALKIATVGQAMMLPLMAMAGFGTDAATYVGWSNSVLGWGPWFETEIGLYLMTQPVFQMESVRLDWWSPTRRQFRCDILSRSMKT